MRLETKNTSDLFNRVCERLVAIDERRQADDAKYEADWRRNWRWVLHFLPNLKPSPAFLKYPSRYGWGTKHRLERLFALFSYEISNSGPHRIIHLEDEDLDALGM